MKKVYYSVKRYKRNDMIEQKGVGYITDTDLVIACISQNNKPYIRVFEDCIKDCHPIPYRPNEYQGGYYEIREIDIDTGKDNYEKREVQLDYKIWYKIIEE